MGKASRRYLAKPYTVRLPTTSPASLSWSISLALKPYCERWASSAITTILLRLDKVSKTPTSLSAWNFWMVVKITPPEPTFSNSFKCSRDSAFTGVCRNNWLPAAQNVPNNCSSKSLRSVNTTMVGFFNAKTILPV